MLDLGFFDGISALLVFSIMHSNIWNLRSGKERLEIINKTQAHKKHLMNILSAKSKINTHNVITIRQPSSPVNIFRKKIIEEDNRTLARKIASMGRPVHQRLNTSLSLSRNLKTYSSLNRNMRQKEIDNENGRMFSRLIMTSPTIRRQSWIKGNMQTSKYKQNLHRGKYRQPDYSQEACKLICHEPKFKCLKVCDSDRRTRLVKKQKVL